jgi:hypothetical protein
VTVNRTLERTAPVRLRDVVLARTPGALLVLAGLMLLAFVVRMWLNTRVEAPWLMADELTYSEMAKSFAAGHGLEVRGFPPNVRTLYPVLISPAWLLDSVQAAYGTAKTINTVAMTLSAIPLYLWARRLVSNGWALAAATLLLLMPAFAYSGMIMTESAFLPLFLLALYTLSRALETPTLAWQLLAVATVLPAVCIRLQGLVLLPVLVTAIVLDALVMSWAGNGRLRVFIDRLRTFAPTGIALLVLVTTYVAYALISYERLSDGLGGYGGVVQLRYSFWDGLRWTVFHAGELAFAVGFLPASAFLVLAALWMRSGRPPAERAFACVTTAALLWIVPLAGFYASRYSGRIEERNMFFVEPLLLLALVAWVAHGAPRPPRWTAAAVAIPAALLTAIPLERLFNVPILSETLALIPLMRLSTLVEGGTDATRVLLALGAVAAALLFVFVPRRLAAGTIGAVAVFLALSAWSAAGTLREQARVTRLETQTENADWIDDAVGRGANVPFVFTPDLVADSHLLWQTEFWNRSVGDVYGLDSADPTGTAVVPTTVDSRGRFVRTLDRRPLAPGYVVAQPGLDIAGEKVGAQGRLVLYRLRAPLRLETRLDGVYGDGWSGPTATYTNYSQSPGMVRVAVGRGAWGGPDVPGSVTIDVERLDSGRRVSSVRWVVHNASRRIFRLMTPAAAFRVEVRVQPTFSPASYGSSDQRQLGAQLAFAFEPRSKARK